MATDVGKHVMLSYNHKSKSVVQAVYNGLRAENIPVWFDEPDMQDNMYTRYTSQCYASFSSIITMNFLCLVWLKQYTMRRLSAVL